MASKSYGKSVSKSLPGKCCKNNENYSFLKPQNHKSNCLPAGKQFFKQYPDIVFRLWRCGMQGCESHERTPPPEDYESKLSLWHPQAEFRGFWLSGWIKLTTVISTASMSPIQSKKGLEKAEQEGRMINPGWEDYLASLKKNSNRSKFFVYR